MRIDPCPSSLTRAYSKVSTEFRGAGKIIDWNIECNGDFLSTQNDNKVITTW